MSSQTELVDNVKVQAPLGSSNHSQIHFNKQGIHIKKSMEEELQ